MERVQKILFGMTKKRRKTAIFKPFKNEYQKPITTDFSSTHKFATFVPKGLIIN